MKTYKAKTLNIDGSKKLSDLSQYLRLKVAFKQNTKVSFFTCTSKGYYYLYLIWKFHNRLHEWPMDIKWHLTKQRTLAIFHLRPEDYSGLTAELTELVRISQCDIVLYHP